MYLSLISKHLVHSSGTEVGGDNLETCCGLYYGKFGRASPQNLRFPGGCPTKGCRGMIDS